MNSIRLYKAAVAMAVILTISACSAEDDGNRTIIKEPDKTITVIENSGKEEEKPGISVKKIDRFKNLEISDWLSETTVIVSKENETLGKMSLQELSDSYPRSLYLYDLSTGEYKLLNEQKDLNLGGATLSPDKKYLLYHGNSLGDPSYYVIGLDTLKASSIKGAYSANWADDETVIGGSYSGGAYLADTNGLITSIDGLEDEALYIVRKVKEKVYYNTEYDVSLMVLNLETKEKTKLNINHVTGLYPSSDGSQLLVLQDDGIRRSLILCDSDGKKIKSITEGIGLGGVSWSPDQRMISYSLKADTNSTSVSALYIHDILSGEDTRIAIDAESLSTSWSPSGKELVYTQWNGTQYDSSIIYLDY